MATKRPSWLFSTEWVHVSEEDTPAGAVYRPASAPIPLSRRPRERLEFAPDGSARLSRPGADERLAARRARWTDTDDALVVQDDGEELLIVDASPERLVVQRRRP